VLSSRKIDNGSCLKYHNQYYLPVDSRRLAVHHRKGTTVMVIKAFDLADLPKNPQKRYVPPMSHPWKQDSFDRYMKKLKHCKKIA